MMIIFIIIINQYTIYKYDGGNSNNDILYNDNITTTIII